MELTPPCEGQIQRGLGGGAQGLRLSDRRKLVYVATGCDFRLVSEWPVVFTRREEGCVFMRVSVFTSVGLEEDRGNLCVYLSVKLPVLIRFVYHQDLLRQ